MDDDPTVHAAWQERFAAVSGEIATEHFFDPQSAVSWFVQNKEKIGNYRVLSDYDLRAQEATGLDVIERLKLTHPEVVLVTSAYDDIEVRSRCDELKIKILPKPSLAYTPVVVV